MDQTRKRGLTHPVVLFSVAAFAFTYGYPRLLLRHLGMDHPWTSYFYLYGFGGLFFLAGIALILKSRACRFGRGHDTFWFAALIIGFFFCMFMHGSWTLLALYVPVKGAF